MESNQQGKKDLKVVQVFDAVSPVPSVQRMDLASSIAFRAVLVNKDNATRWTFCVFLPSTDYVASTYPCCGVYGGMLPDCVLLGESCSCEVSCCVIFYVNSAAIRSFVCNYACVNIRSEISWWWL